MDVTSERDGVGAREERKVVTVVFADLAGSTALGEALDPEEVKLIVGEAVSRIVLAVESMGGTVKDLAGDGVLSFFGAPVAHEDDAERGLRAALRIVQEIEAYGSEAAGAWGVQGLAVRVGVSTGPVVLGQIGAGRRVEYAAFGDTVNTAARLQAQAEPNTALAGAATRRMAEPAFDWGPGQTIEVKGKAEPVAASRVLGVSGASGRSRGIPGVQAALVGRERELEQATRLIQDVRAGTGGILFVTGEAGIGKRRLLQELRERFERPGGEGHAPPVWLEGRCVSYGESLQDAEGNPFYLEELIRSLADAGALVRDEEGWRFDHEAPVDIPQTVEKVILARIDRLPPAQHDVLTAASVLGRRFGLPLLEGVTGGEGDLRGSLHELQRLDLVREGRRWPQPEYRFKHALIQEAAYRTILTGRRTALHRRAAEWLEARYAGNEEEVWGVLAHHWAAADDEDKAVAYLTLAGDKARQEYALDEAIGHYRALLPLLERRRRQQAMAVVLFKLGLALHTSLRFAEANATYQRAFELWRPKAAYPETPSATLRVATSFLPNDADPKSAIAWPDIQLCMQLFDRLVEAWPERTLVPSLAERWEIAEDGLRYVFHLRDGLRWSDGEPLTAHDVEFGIKRVLDPASPGSSVAIYFVLENGQDYYLGRNTDADRIGVKALDDRTVEFRLAAPAPYFMSVMNRPDGGPQPRHAIERDGTGWTDPARQVVSGPFRQASRAAETLTLERNPGYVGTRSGNVGGVEYVRHPVGDAAEPFRAGRLDLIAVRYTPRIADLMPRDLGDTKLGPAAWSGYVAFDHRDPVTQNLDLRRALAHAVDRERLAATLPPNLAVALGGVVPPALQGHTPDMAPRFDPDLARELLRRSGHEGELSIAALRDWEGILREVAAMWTEALGVQVSTRTWTQADLDAGVDPRALAPMVVTGWLPGYPDPEYYLRLLFQSDSKTNEGGFAYAPFDDLIEQARQERRDRERLELFHRADRMIVAERVAVIPLVYGRSMAFVKPWVGGWWEFGKSSSSFADLLVDPSSPRF